MNLVQLFAHATEEHVDTAEAVSHAITPWFVAVPLFLLAVAVVGYISWVVSGRRVNTVMFVLVLSLLISGFTMFNISSAISVISITLGVILAGILAFAGLSD